MSEPAQLIPLAEDFTRHLVQSKFDPEIKRFLPALSIHALVTPQRIRLELGCGDGETSIVAWTMKHASKVFLATVLSDLKDSSALLDAIQTFHNLGYDDRSLENDELTDEDARGFASSNHPECFPSRIWTLPKYGSFCRAKRQLDTPVFCSDIDDYRLFSSTILPVVKRGFTPKEGAFSRVHRVELHGDHARHGFKDVSTAT